MNERRKEGGGGGDKGQKPIKEGKRNNCRARERVEHEWRVGKEGSSLESIMLSI